MGKEPKVSIILVNYNGYKDTIECLLSLRKIAYTNYEVIVVDNASTNESVREINNILCDGEVLIVAQNNDGFSAGNNIGIRYALEHQAVYCLLLNNDTEVQENFLTELLKTAEQYHGKAVVTSKILYFYDKNKIWYAGGTFSSVTSRTTHIGINEIDTGQYNHTMEVSFISGCCMLLPIEIINCVGLMDEDYFLYCEDLAYCCEIKKAGYKLVYEPCSLIFHKVNASTRGLSDIVVYYSVRNKLYIISNYIPWTRKMIAYTYQFIENSKRILTGEYRLGIICKATKSFFSKKLGK